MSKTLSRIFTAIGSLVLLYLSIAITANISQLADAADRVYMGLGQPVFWILLSIFLSFLILPFVLYFKLPKALVPPEETTGPKHDAYMTHLRTRLKNNSSLKGMPLESDDDVIAAITILSKEANKVIKQTAGAVFVSTAISQNGRLDGLVTLLSQARMVWRVACVFQQRPSPRQMLNLYSNVGMNVFFAESIDDIDVSEIIAPIISAGLSTSVASGAISSIGSLLSIGFSASTGTPPISGESVVPQSVRVIEKQIINNITSGAANAFLTLRVGVITRQYCECISTPSGGMVRRIATLAAVNMVGDIVKENSGRIIGGAWAVIKGRSKDGFDSASQLTKNLAGKVSSSVVAGVKSAGEVVISASGKASDSVATGAKSIGNTVSSISVTASQSAFAGAKSVGNIVGDTAGKVSGTVMTGAKSIGNVVSSAVEKANSYQKPKPENIKSTTS